MPSIELNADRLLDAFKKNLTAEVSSDGVEIPSQEDEESIEIDMEADQHAGAQKEHHDQGKALANRSNIVCQTFETWLSMFERLAKSQNFACQSFFYTSINYFWSFLKHLLSKIS